MKFNDLCKLRKITNNKDDALSIRLFFETLKSGEISEELGKITYTKLVALPRPMLENDYVLYTQLKNNNVSMNKYTQISGLDTFFFTLNSFRYMYRDENCKKNDFTDNYTQLNKSYRNLTVLNCIGLDIDNTTLTLDEVKEAVNSILPCTFIVKSGHGFHIYWNIKNVSMLLPEKEKEERLICYKKVCKYLDNELMKKGIVCDHCVTGDTQRILRMPTSYNTKNGDCIQTKIVYSDPSVVYKLQSLYKMFNCSNVDINYKLKVSIKQLKKVKVSKKIEKIVLNKDINISSSKSKRKNKKVLLPEDKEYDVLPSGFNEPNPDLYIRPTQRLYYDQIYEDRIYDIKNFVGNKKNYTGRRYKLLQYVIMLTCQQNFFLELRDKQTIDTKQLVLEVNSLFSEPVCDKNISKLFDYIKTVEDNIYRNFNNKEDFCSNEEYVIYKISNDKLADILGLTPIDMTYSRQIMTSEEIARRKKLRVKYHNTKNNPKNNAKNNPINNAKRSKLAKENKALKIQKENDEVDALLKQNLTVAKIIETLSGKYSASKVKRIIKRIKDK